jgi:hypothetical protein
VGSFTNAGKFYGGGLTEAVYCAKRASAAARAASGALMISHNSWGRSSISKVRNATRLLLAHHILYALDGLGSEPEAQRQIITFAAPEGIAQQCGNPGATILLRLA